MNLQVLNINQFKSFSLLQFKTDFVDSFEYQSMETALVNNWLEIKEVSESGNVNLLEAINLSEFYIFLMDGDILQGAKQNRVLNTSILLKPQSKTKIPVSCVEQGRWQHTSRRFFSSDIIAPSSLRGKKSEKVFQNLREEKHFMSDQNEVWNQVNYFSNKFAQLPRCNWI